jgi:hypothetical protein
VVSQPHERGLRLPVEPLDSLDSAMMTAEVLSNPLPFAALLILAPPEDAGPGYCDALLVRIEAVTYVLVGWPEPVRCCPDEHDPNSRRARPVRKPTTYPCRCLLSGWHAGRNERLDRCGRRGTRRAGYLR